MKPVTFILLLGIVQVSFARISGTSVSLRDGSLQQRQVTGTVVDEFGEPLPGVYVTIKGTNTGTITDIDGKYSIQASPESTLVFSFIGIVPQEITVGSQTHIDVKLQTKVSELEEVVVIGYGTTTRGNFTGAVSTVSVSESALSQIQTTSPLNLLEGVTSGVAISQSGEAGKSSNILVRGQKSISGGSDPLIVLDGVIFNGNIESIDPGIIKEISILKDATSLAAYGSRAANGVVMITTKIGQVGKPVINLRSSTTVITPNFRPKMRDGAGYIELMNARLHYPEGTDPASWMSPVELENYRAGKTTDWYDLIVKTGFTNNFSADISGGTENIKYLVGAMHNDQESFIVGDNYKRTTFNAKVDTKINNYISIGANFNQGFMERYGERPDYGGAVAMSPWASPYLSDGVTFRKYPDGKEETSVNPLWNYSQGINNNTFAKSAILGGNLNITLPWIKGLSFKMTGSYSVNASTTKRFAHETNWVNLSLGEAAYTPDEYKNFLKDATGTLSDSKSDNWTLDNILNYTENFGKHSVNATLVYTRSHSKNDEFSITGKDYTGLGNTILGIYGINNAANRTATTSYTEKADIAYLGRLIYSYSGKYQINASIRRDGSSVFGSDNKWGLFPAIGLAWTISNENFMSGVRLIDYMKLKFSYGKNGNQSLSPYGTLSTIGMGLTGNQLYIFDNRSVYFGQRLTALGNPMLAWETTKSFNVGLETDLLNRRIHFETDIYKSQTTDQIFSRTIPVMGAGITTQQSTMGQVDNWGIEINATTHNISKANLNWRSGIVFSLNRNKLIEIDGSGKDFVDNNLFLGKSLGAIYGYKWIGIVQADDLEYINANGAVPGDAKYANLDGSDDNRITIADRTVLGYSKESFRMSLTNNLSYKNFSLYVMLNGIFSGGNYGLARNNDAYLSFGGWAVRNALDHPYWTADNPSKVYPRNDYYDTKFIALQKYTFVRLQDINLSYNLTPLVKKWKLNSMSVYLAGKNLAFWAPHWEFSDPQVRSFNAAQLQRQFTLGINVGF